MDLVSPGGRLYISFPVGQDEVHFNAHRIHHPKTILSHASISKHMKLLRFDFVDDDGDLHLNIDIAEVDPQTKYGCGIYTFEKVKE